MMKNAVLALSVIIFMILPASAHDREITLKTENPIGNMQSVTSLNGFVFMADQPDEATLKKLKSEKFNVVINVRDPAEMTLEEKSIVEAEGLTYFNVPLLKDGKIQDSAVKKIYDIIEDNEDKKILLHCSSGNRAASWFGAHLVRDAGYDHEAAVKLAKQAGMTKDSMEKILRAYFDNLIE